MRKRIMKLPEDRIVTIPVCAVNAAGQTVPDPDHNVIESARSARPRRLKVAIVNDGLAFELTPLTEARSRRPIPVEVRFTDGTVLCQSFRIVRP